MRLHADLYSATAWLHIRTDLFDVITANLSNSRRFSKNSLARRRKLVDMRFDASSDATLTQLHACTLRLDIGRALLCDRLLCH